MAMMNLSRTNSVVVLLLCCCHAVGALADSTIYVDTTAMEVSDSNPTGIVNGRCSLDEAFFVFGGSGVPDCVPQVSGGTSPLVIELQPVVYSLIRRLTIIDSAQGDEIQIQGNGAIIERSDTATDDFQLIRAIAASPDSTLWINDLTLRNSETTEIGAALYTTGFNLELYGVTFRNNYSMGMDGIAGRGGALWASSPNSHTVEIKIQHCRFEENSADQFAGAVSLGEVSGTISNSTFVNNSAVSSAGAIYLGYSNVTIVNSEFIGNHTSVQGGAIQANGQADSPSTNGTTGLHIVSSQFRNNTASIYGGAIRSTANPTVIRHSLFQGNESDRGGAIVRGLPYATEFTISNSTFTDNIASANGGAIAIQHGKVSLQSVTMVGNTAERYGGGIWMDDTATASASVDHSIIHSNSAGIGSGDCHGNSRSGGDYSIFSHCDLPLAAHEVNQSVTILEDMLLPLNNNGGDTKTFEPVEGGIAHNRGTRENLADFDFDQRRFPRIAEGRVDIGAHERSAEAVAGMFDVVFNSSMESDDAVRFFDRDAFLAQPGGYDATGALPALGNQRTNPNPIDLGILTFVRYHTSSFNLAQWSNKIPALPDTGDTVDLALNGLEEFDVQSLPIRAFGFDYVDPDGDATRLRLQACASTFDPVSEYCPQKDIVFAMDFSSDDTNRRFFGFTVNQRFRQVSIRELSNSGSNEYFGHFYTLIEP